MTGHRKQCPHNFGWFIYTWFE